MKKFTCYFVSNSGRTDSIQEMFHDKEWKMTSSVRVSEDSVKPWADDEKKTCLRCTIEAKNLEAITELTTPDYLFVTEENSEVGVYVFKEGQICDDEKVRKEFDSFVKNK